MCVSTCRITAAHAAADVNEIVSQADGDCVWSSLARWGVAWTLCQSALNRWIIIRRPCIANLVHTLLNQSQQTDTACESIRPDHSHRGSALRICEDWQCFQRKCVLDISPQNVEKTKYIVFSSVCPKLSMFWENLFYFVAKQEDNNNDWRHKVRNQQASHWTTQHITCSETSDQAFYSFCSLLLNVNRQGAQLPMKLHCGFLGIHSHQSSTTW